MNLWMFIVFVVIYNLSICVEGLEEFIFRVVRMVVVMM